MMRKPHLDTEAGRKVFAMLNRISQTKGRSLHNVVVRFALERFLHRVFSDETSGSERLFINPRTRIGIDPGAVTLKGGMTMTFAEGLPVLDGRSTGDADLHLASFGGDMEDYRAILENGLVGAPRSGEDDGIRFDIEAIRVAKDREERSGGSVVIPLQIGQYYLQIKTDVTFDARPMHERAPVVDYPSVLPETVFPAPVVRRVPYEYMVADKFVAALGYGMANKRVRDYPDMRLVLGKGLVDPEFLAETIAATVRFQERDLPASMDEVAAFSEAFAQAKNSRWEQERKDRRYVVQEDFFTMLAWLREHLEPILQRAREIEQLPSWSSGPR